jgi:hypothetical protein
VPLQRRADLVEDRGIVDCRRHGLGVLVGGLLFARAGLRQPGDRDREPEGRHQADLLADARDAFLLNLDQRPVMRTPAGPAALPGPGTQSLCDYSGIS